jgi:hypothetical protein
LFFSHQTTAKGIAASLDQPIGEQNVVLSDVKIRKLMYQAIYVD